MSIAKIQAAMRKGIKPFPPEVLAAAREGMKREVLSPEAAEFFRHHTLQLPSRVPELVAKAGAEARARRAQSGSSWDKGFLSRERPPAARRRAPGRDGRSTY